MTKGFITIFVVSLLLAGCKMSYWPETITTGFEDFELSNDSLFVKVGDKFVFAPGTIDSVALEGKFSIVTNENKSVAIEYVIEKPKPDSKFLITCWTHCADANNVGDVVAFIKRNEKLIELERQTGASANNNNWKLLELLVQLPPNHDGSSLIIRLENRGNSPVWFDEFKLEFIDKVYYPEFEDEESLLINLTEPDLERLREMRLAAFEKGYIDMGKQDWIAAEIIWRDSVFKAMLRFKGDNLKHLTGDKWSLTIDIEGGTVMGMRRFALQTPELRSFLDEWLFHKVLQQENLATSKYSFAPVRINQRSLGVYALVEDQRDEEFLDRFGDGAVLRFDDVSYWQNINSKSNLPEDEVFKSASIQTIASVSISKPAITAFEEAVNSFRKAEGNTAQLFEIDKAAKMLAVCDVMESHNALHWVNVRFFGNDASGKLEFIGHDGFSAIDTLSVEGSTFLNYLDFSQSKPGNPQLAMYINLFNDSTFTRFYYRHLNRISEEKYFNILKLNTIAEMKYHQLMLRKEWPAYRFDYSRWLKRAMQLRKKMERQVNSGVKI